MDSRLTLPVNTLLDKTYRIERVVGSGGFGITYQAEDIKLRTKVALKEYYPLDFGDRDSTMSVKPKSDRHAKTFQWGRSNFLQEARTLARFEHPAIVRVTRVFESNSTAYMVMRFEQGQSFEEWLRGLGRPPTQAELDRIAAPILDALQVMHAENFLHRDIAPDNIIVRSDGTPVLLDFGAARHAVAEMSRTITGIVKAGYSPHEQYSADGRLQGPWSDIYALGGTLYRAVAGRSPEEAALRVDHDDMKPAAQAAKGDYRPGFLAAIDMCLRVRHAERPRSVAQLRPLLFGETPPPKREAVVPPSKPSKPSQPRRVVSTLPSQVRRPSTPPVPVRKARWLAAAAALLAIAGGAYGGYEFVRWQPSGQGGSQARQSAAEAEARRQAALEAVRHQADLDAQRRRQEEASAAAARQADLDAQRRRQDEAAEAARRQAELDAEQRRREEAERVAAAEAARRAEDEEARRRAASAVLSAEERINFVRQVQQVLKDGRCYEGAVNGRNPNDTQEALDSFIANAGRKGGASPGRIELAKATAGDFETWLRDAATVKGDVCAPAPAPTKPKVAKPTRDRDEEPDRRRAERRAPAPEAREYRRSREPEERETKFCWGPRNELNVCR